MRRPSRHCFLTALTRDDRWPSGRSGRRKGGGVVKSLCWQEGEGIGNCPREKLRGLGLKKKSKKREREAACPIPSGIHFGGEGRVLRSSPSRKKRRRRRRPILSPPSSSQIFVPRLIAPPTPLYLITTLRWLLRLALLLPLDLLLRRKPSFESVFIRESLTSSCPRLPQPSEAAATSAQAKKRPGGGGEGQ